MIEIHKEYFENKRERKDTDEIFENFYLIRKQLKTKFGKNFMEIVEIILTNFEELYENEWRLQQQLIEKEQITITKQLIEDNIDKLNINIIKINKLEGHLLMNCEIGDQANFSYKQITANHYTTKIEEVEELALEEQFQTKIEIPPK